MRRPNTDAAQMATSGEAASQRASPEHLKTTQVGAASQSSAEHLRDAQDAQSQSPSSPATDASDEDEPQPPHILLLMVDDTGFNDVSWNNPMIYTPTLNRLASEGIILNQHYTQPVCTPSRSALMTGLYPFHTGDQHRILQPGTPVCAARSHRFLPEKLKDLGYTTHAIGKWHLGFCNETCTPLRRGFDTFSGFYNGMINHFDYNAWIGHDWNEGMVSDPTVRKTYTTELITDRVLKRIEEHDTSKPAFFYVSYAATHIPIQAPDRYMRRYPTSLPEIRRRYLGMVTAVDESVKNITQKLQEKHMWEQTMVIFLSDNGAEFVGVPNPGSNAPLRGAKTTLYEGGTRTPAFVHGRDMLRAGFSTNGLFHITDWHSTILSIAGASPEPDLDGLDQTDMLFHGQSSRRKEVIYNIDLENSAPFGRAAIRRGEYKLIQGYPGKYDGWEQDETLGLGFHSNLLFPEHPTDMERARPKVHHLGLVNYQELLKPELTSEYIYKLTDNLMLFNLRDDPEERHNLASVRPDKVEELLARLDELIPEVVPPNPRMSEWSPDSHPAKYWGTWKPGWC